MPAATFHGVRVTWSARGVGGDPVGALFQRLRTVGGHARADLHIAVDTARQRHPSEWGKRAVAFRQGDVCGYPDGDALRIRDGASEIVVTDAGRTLLVSMFETNDRDATLFAHRTLMTAFVVALRHRGLFHVHGGAVADDDGRSIVIAGTGGAGKSTTTLSLVEAGYRPLSDDTLFLGHIGRELRVLGFPRDFHVAPRTAAAFPRLAPWLGAPRGALADKRALDVGEAFGDRLMESAELPSTLLFPEVTATATTELEELSKAEGLGRLIESSAWLVVDELGHKELHLAALREVADHAQSYRLRLGADALERPAIVAQRLGELRR